MKDQQTNSPKKVCDSWYHHRWFRVILIIVALDMIVLGVSFALGYDLVLFFSGITGPVLRAIIGIMYIMVATFIIKETLGYNKLKKDHAFICQHCASDLMDAADDMLTSPKVASQQ